MSDPRIPSQWQLKDTGEAGDQWMLRDSEQRLPGHLQLQNDADYAPPDMGWQPIDYRAMQQAAAPRARGGWILGTVLLVVLVGVAAYVTFYFMGTPAFLAGIFPTQEATVADAANTTGEPDSAAVPAAGESGDGTGTAAESAGSTASDPNALAAVLPVTGTVAATGTTTVTEATAARGGVSGAAGAADAVAAIPTPTATPAPTPTPTPEPVVVRTATVSSGAGVNLRRNPLGTAELIRTLPDNSSYVIASGPITGTDGGRWVQLALTDTLGYVSADFATIVTQTLPFSQAVTL
ncbi:MAG: hypothetical protein ACRC1H_07365, partial [Caldilineaceae bacterium]